MQCKLCDKVMQGIVGMPATEFEALSAAGDDRFQEVAARHP